jgi:hypothetical protein
LYKAPVKAAKAGKKLEKTRDCEGTERRKE